MIEPDTLEILADGFCACTWSMAIGLVLGSYWMRREWIKACLGKKLLKFNRTTARLTWQDGSELP